MPTKMPMTGWFDPGQLLQTGVRVAISTVFGQFADKREALAAANPIDDAALDPCFDYSARCPEGEFWFDFVADTGDGWNPTYAVARLLAADSLNLDGAKESLPRGRVLIMGGDEVYPTPSPEEYENRLIYPYDAAYRPGGQAGWPRPEPMRGEDADGGEPASPGRGPDLFAVPGNHDWYDGLSSFFHLFCRRTVKQPHEAEIDRDGRAIGGRQTYQTRSYFALKLPNGWWLWGTDCQLEGYIDQPQIDFFQFVAEKWMDDGSKLILCAGTPDWEYVDPEAPEKKFSTLSYLERLAPAARNKGHQLKLVLSGDSHHYARFLEGDRNYITCGGGGAFLHPTHHLKKGTKAFKFPYPEPGAPYDPKHGLYDRSFTIATKAGSGDEALYPDRLKSHALTAGNVFFAFRNLRFTATLLPIYLLFTWLLDFNSWVFWRHSLANSIAPGSLWDAMYVYWRLVFLSPWPVVLCALAFAGYSYFADVKSGFWRLMLGGAHALLQAVVVTAATCVVIEAMAPWWMGFWGMAACLFAAALTSAIVSATMFGLYLWLSLAVFKIHWNEAFSSLAIQGYKCFLRLRIAGDGTLTIFPIGLTKVPSDNGKTTKDPPLEPHLIEPPIEIAP
jgi:hypothetical protein